MTKNLLFGKLGLYQNKQRFWLKVAAAGDEENRCVPHELAKCEGLDL